MRPVSIVVPVYNAEEKIKRCVDSLLGQTFSDIEIILVDDGSTDNSPAICDSFSKKDDRIHTVHQANAGVSAARDAGIEAASGEWLMFIDADDWIEPDTIRFMVALLEKTNADIGVYSFVNEYGKSVSELVIDDSCRKPSEIIQDYQNINNVEAIICSVCNKLYRRSIIADGNIRFETGIKFGEDFIFNSNILKCVGIVMTSSCLFYHYDCTSENSGVKKLYYNYDEFIVSMGKAACSMAEALNIDALTANSFLRNFIGKRWSYAVNVCLSSAQSEDECAKIIFRWMESMPEDIREWGECSSHEIGQLLEVRDGDVLTLQSLSRRIRRMRKDKKKRDRIVGFKCLVRRLIRI